MVDKTRGAGKGAEAPAAKPIDRRAQLIEQLHIVERNAGKFGALAAQTTGDERENNLDESQRWSDEAGRIREQVREIDDQDALRNAESAHKRFEDNARCKAGADEGKGVPERGRYAQGPDGKYYNLDAYEECIAQSDEERAKEYGGEPPAARYQSTAKIALTKESARRLVELMWAGISKSKEKNNVDFSAGERKAIVEALNQKEGEMRRELTSGETDYIIFNLAAFKRALGQREGKPHTLALGEITSAIKICIGRINP